MSGGAPDPADSADAAGATDPAGRSTEPALAQPGSATEMFLTFTAIALQSFGGALAIMERAVVRRKRWFTSQEFLGIYAISQVMPGPTGIAMCVLMGDRYFGLRGAVASLCGFILVPAVVVLGLAATFLQFQHLPWVQGALKGMGAASVGIILTLAWRLSRGLRGRTRDALVALLSFAAVALLHWPVGLVLLTLGLISVALAWREG